MFPASPNRLLSFFIVLLGVISASTTAANARPQQTAGEERVQEFRLRSELLSAFWGRDVFVEAGVVLPPEHDQRRDWPVCYSIHGFGGSHRSARMRGPQLVAAMDQSDYPRMIYVFLNAACPMGHHEFADSVNNGPWGQALVEEFVPALEAKFRALGEPRGRFLTGHSSGGWSSLWLQVTYPEFFAGTWSTAPDPVDFRDFTGVDIYRYESAYVDPEGQPIQLVRRNGEWMMSLQAFVEREVTRRPIGGQFYSFDAVFSPRAKDGTPMKLFDRETGKIDPFVARSWEKYDISLILRRRWEELGPKLAGKLRVYCGTIDTFRLEGALKRMAEELEALGSDAEIVFVEGRDHGTLFRPHEELWPKGLLEFIHRDMLRVCRQEPR